MHYALLVGNLTKDLTVITNGRSTFSDEQLTKLNNHRINVIESAVIKIEHEAGHLRSVVLENGRTMPFDALYYKPPFTQHSDIPATLGCEFTEQGHLKIDAFHQTTVTGVYACGDNSSMMRSVANAVAAGNFAGAVVNKDLAMEQF
jgi:thioredoxin reductase